MTMVLTAAAELAHAKKVRTNEVNPIKVELPPGKPSPKSTILDPRNWRPDVSDPLSRAKILALTYETVSDLISANNSLMLRFSDGMRPIDWIPENRDATLEMAKVFLLIDLDIQEEDHKSRLSTEARRHFDRFADDRVNARQNPWTDPPHRLLPHWIESNRKLRSEYQRILWGAASGKTSTPRDRLLDDIADSLSGGDFHERVYIRTSLQAFVDQPASGHGPLIGRFQFVGKPSIEALGKFAGALQRPVPGGEPKLVIFLDATVHEEPIQAMSKAWRSRGGADPDILDHTELDRYMSHYSGQTLIFVGHNEGGTLVVKNLHGEPSLRIEIKALLAAAKRHRVLLHLMSCDTDGTKAFMGFMREIYTSEIAESLRAMPRGPMTIGDLLGRAAAAGPVRVVIDEFADTVRLVIDGPPPDLDPMSNSAEQPGPKIIMDIPLHAHVAAASTSEDCKEGAKPTTCWAEFDREWTRLNRPIYDRGLLRWLWVAFRANAWATLLGLAATSLALWRTVRFAHLKHLRPAMREYQELRYVEEGLRYLAIALGAVAITVFVLEHPIVGLCVLAAGHAYAAKATKTSNKG